MQNKNSSTQCKDLIKIKTKTKSKKHLLLRSHQHEKWTNNRSFLHFPINYYHLIIHLKGFHNYICRRVSAIIDLTFKQLIVLNCVSK